MRLGVFLNVDIFSISSRAICPRIAARQGPDIADLFDGLSHRVGLRGMTQQINILIEYGLKMCVSGINKRPLSITTVLGWHFPPSQPESMLTNDLLDVGTIEIPPH